MSIEDNYWHQIDEVTGVAIFVDSFDNKEFDVRIGTITDSEPAGTITASSDEELNAKLAELYNKFQQNKGN
ncbi:MAG TPA: hypothetical protein PKD17_10715 [Cellvibrionaceae bacterium]|nr:hypothetical protein [Cellvibrionaceae bacterium]HNG59240.1 hypothetical protein [Cellvibrionaceae bacterium]